MEGKQPTPEQIKEFWEWCGLIKIKRGWKFSNGDVLFDADPSIDLNNLFKYAVPKLEAHWIRFSGLSCTIRVWEDGREYYKQSEDPALALFWAIWEIIQKEVKDG